MVIFNNQKRRLGRGIEALIPKSTFEPTKIIMDVDVDNIKPNPLQPRTNFSENQLKELAQSIKEHGLAHPIIVRRKNNYFELIAGERRLRASKLAGLQKITAIVKELNEQDSLELSLVENIQREDLSPLEEAEAFYKLSREYKLSQNEISKIVGKSRSTVANTMRLIELPEEIKYSLKSNEISEGHARAILSISNSTKQVLLWNKILQQNLNVRASEFLASSFEKTTPKKHKKRHKNKDNDMSELEDNLSLNLGTKVTIHGNQKSGKLVVSYFSQEDLERLSEKLTNC